MRRYKPCPFCGGEVEFVLGNADELGYGCLDCKAEFRWPREYPTDFGKSAAEMWNARCAEGERLAELEYIKAFAKESHFDEDLCRDQLRCLWTAYCFRHNLDVDTAQHDTDLMSVWEVVDEPDCCDWHDFDTFGNFMCRYLV